MAKLILTINNITSEIEIKNSAAMKVCNRAWEAYHRNGEIATDQEKLDWVVDVLLRGALSRASARKDRMEEREERRTQQNARRAQREASRELQRTAPKFE